MWKILRIQHRFWRDSFCLLGTCYLLQFFFLFCYVEEIKKFGALSPDCFVSVINFTFWYGIGHCSGILFNFRWIFIYWLINQLEFKLLALTWKGSVLFSSKYMCLILFSFFPFFICYAENGIYVVCDGFFYVFFLTVIFWAVALTPEYNEFVPSSSFDFLFDIENYVKRTGGALFCVLGGAVWFWYCPGLPLFCLKRHWHNLLAWIDFAAVNHKLLLQPRI